MGLAGISGGLILPTFTEIIEALRKAGLLVLLTTLIQLAVFIGVATWAHWAIALDTPVIFAAFLLFLANWGLSVQVRKGKDKEIEIKFDKATRRIAEQEGQRVKLRGHIKTLGRSVDDDDNLQ